MSDVVPIGTRIRFTKRLDAPANEDHPAVVYAEKGSLGTVIGHKAREGYQVTWDNWPHWFGASRDEFEIVNAQPAKE